MSPGRVAISSICSANVAHFQLVDHAPEAEVKNGQLRMPDRPGLVSTSSPIKCTPSCGRKSDLNLQRQET
jgi:hypothetical protein